MLGLRMKQISLVEGGKMASVCCCVFPPSFHGGWLLCVLLLPFVEAFLQCSLLHSWQIECRGRFSAVNVGSSGFTLQYWMLSLFTSQYLL